MRSVSVAVVAFLVGLAGMLAVAALHLANAPLLIAVVLVGTVAAAFTGERRAVIGLVAMTLGLLAAYPVALGLGAIAFLGDAWQIAVIAIVAAAGVGFCGCLVVVRLARDVGRRQT